MWPAIVGIARVVGTMASGYWLNDFATWVNNTLGLGTKTLNSKQNGFSWWYLTIIMIVLAGMVLAVVYFISMLAGKGRKARRRR